MLDTGVTYLHCHEDNTVQILAEEEYGPHSEMANAILTTETPSPERSEGAVS
jgi:hypothetical protein